MAAQPGELTFAVNRVLLAGGLAVSDAVVLRAIKFALLKLKLVIEPGGAAALACALAYRDRWRDRNVVVVASGGNADPAILVQALESEDLIPE
jgi:threonine dehydratase